MRVLNDNTKRNKRFEKLCLMSQQTLKAAMKKELRKMGREVESGNGYIYSKGTLPIILMAHMDTVHKELPKTIIYSNGTISSPEGIGGDDRCGIYMVMEIIKELDCHVLFLEEEERGGKGAEKFTKTETCKSLKGKLNYAIELDRAHSNDSVFYECDNPEFEEFVNKEFWKTDSGSYTDICTICPEIECAGVNLSCGYYKQHTTGEYVVLSEMETSIAETKKLICRTMPEDKFEYIERKWSWKGYYGRSYGYGYGYGYGYDGFYGLEEYYVIFRTNNGEEWSIVEGRSEAEAIGNFLMDHPTLTYNDILEVGYEEDMCAYESEQRKEM